MVKVKCMESEFYDIETFNMYVASLDDQEIQKWSAEEWNQLYEKLDYILEYDDSISEEVCYHNERYCRFLDNKTYFSQTCGFDALKKLYRNFRFDSEDYKILIEDGKNIGKGLAHQRLDLAGSTVINDEMETNRLKDGKKIDKTVYDATYYRKCKINPKTKDKRYRYDKVRSVIQVVPSEKMLHSLGEQWEEDFYFSKINLSDDATEDNFLNTAVHESVHAHFQLSITNQQFERENGILPEKKLSKEFYDLLAHNQDYYLSNFAGGTNDENKKRSEEAKYSYMRQPIEKMASLIGGTAERTFRQMTRQYSERVARDLTDLVDDVQPEYAFYSQNRKMVVLVYNQQTLGVAGRTEDMFKNKYFATIDEKGLEKIKVACCHNYMYVAAPIDYDLRVRLQKAKCRREKEVNVQKGCVNPIDIMYKENLLVK